MKNHNGVGEQETCLHDTLWKDRARDKCYAIPAHRQTAKSSAGTELITLNMFQREKPIVIRALFNCFQ
jgi:hypothetical protein